MTGTALTPQERAALTRRAALASSALAVILIGLKAWAALATSSMAMLGSLADSALDLMASLIVLIGVQIAAAPADREHRFGHGKAEALAALAQVIIITISASFIAFRAVQRLIAGAQTSSAELGIGVSLLAMALTASLVAYQRHVVRRTGSLAIGTDRIHYSSDLMLNASVIVALSLDQFAGLAGADALFGLLIAAWLVWGAWRVSARALDQLMDREWPDELRERFLAAACDYPELAGLHDLRTRSSGTHHFAQFHVWVPATWTVKEAHDRLDRAENSLRARFPDTEILIHVDPEGQVDRETLLPHEITEQAR
ncbi:MAG TPA: cation diffusion facilitator family transporter [Sphingomicrobium sp.]|nr:cation diffusion facilitator family transporter [Sphingomicrobium sp.]